MKTPVDMALEEMRWALIDGLNEAVNRYTLIQIQQLLDGAPIGVAYDLEDATMYVLVSSQRAGLNELQRLDLAKSLTEFFHTFVVPVQSTHGMNFWGGRHGDPFVAYKFALLDRPLKLTY